MKYDERYARADIEIGNVTFDSFCDVRKRIKENDNIKHSARLYYDGSDISGDVRVSFARYADSIVKNEVKDIVMETLKVFS